MILSICIFGGAILLVTDFMDITGHTEIYLLGIFADIVGLTALCFFGSLSQQVCSLVIFDQNWSRQCEKIIVLFVLFVLF